MEPPVSIFKEVIAVIANLDTLETTASQVLKMICAMYVIAALILEK